MMGGVVRDFANDTAGTGDAEFRRWLTENPDAYFVNVTGPERGMLHRGRCPHMKFGPDDPMSLVTRPKWTSEDRRGLEARAQTEGLVLEKCRDCDV